MPIKLDSLIELFQNIYDKDQLDICILESLKEIKQESKEDVNV